MMVNADFSKRAMVHAARLPWSASPLPGVERRMLDRIGGEIARATSIVRYAARSSFAAHAHGAGEEFLVLEGVFQDEHGDYPAGTYVRNPPGSSHTPRSAPGCTIFVKLRQFDASDCTQVRLDTNIQAFLPADERPGVETARLFRDGREDVRLERWSAGAEVILDLPDGGEVLVLEGSFQESEERFERLSWLRLPCGDTLRALTGSAGCMIWMKQGAQSRGTQAVDLH
jgi:anti-sigma factor ChrR (cupin superfamily)